jgi:hypothetical protein
MLLDRPFSLEELKVGFKYSSSRFVLFFKLHSDQAESIFIFSNSPDPPRSSSQFQVSHPQREGHLQRDALAYPDRLHSGKQRSPPGKIEDEMPALLLGTMEKKAIALTALSFFTGHLFDLICIPVAETE